jgi:DNA-binding beta-propeller fold protein YncE
MSYIRRFAMISSRSFLTLLAAGLAILGSASPALASPSPQASAPAACSSSQLASQTYAVTTSSSQSWIYVLDSKPYPHVVKVVDGASAGLKMPGAAVIGNGGKVLYVDDWGTGSIVVVDACTLTPITSINVGSENVATLIPAGGSSDGRYLYVTLPLSGIDVIDTTTNAIVRTYSVPTLIGKVVISPDGSKLYVPTTSSIEVLDAATGQQAAPAIPLSGFPTWDAISADGKFLYTANTLGDSLSAINLTTDKVTTTQLPTGTTPVVVTVKPADGSQVWMADGAASRGMTVFAPDGALEKSIATPGAGVGINFSPDGKYAYAQDMGAGCNLANNGLLTLVLALLGGCTAPGEIIPYRTSNFTQAAPTIKVNGVPVGVYSFEPGVPN